MLAKKQVVKTKLRREFQGNPAYRLRHRHCSVDSELYICNQEQMAEVGGFKLLSFTRNEAPIKVEQERVWLLKGLVLKRSQSP